MRTGSKWKKNQWHQVRLLSKTTSGLIWWPHVPKINNFLPRKLWKIESCSHWPFKPHVCFCDSCKSSRSQRKDWHVAGATGIRVNRVAVIQNRLLLKTAWNSFLWFYFCVYGLYIMPWVCVCEHVCVCEYMCVCYVYYAVCVYVFVSTSHFFSDSVLHWTQSSPIRLSWLAKSFRDILVSPLPLALGLWVYTITSDVLHGFWGSELRFSCLQSWPFTNWTISLVPHCFISCLNTLSAMTTVCVSMHVCVCEHMLGEGWDSESSLSII